MLIEIRIRSSPRIGTIRFFRIGPCVESSKTTIDGTAFVSQGRQPRVSSFFISSGGTQFGSKPACCLRTFIHWSSC